MNRLSFQVIKCPKTSVVANDYIFNVPDGFQRCISDYGISFTTSPIFFITRLKPTNINGLFTYMQTLIANQKASGSKIYGPPGMVKLINAMRYNDIGGYKTLPYSVMDYGGETLLGLKSTEIMDNFINTFQQVCDQSEAVEKIRNLIIDPKDCNDASTHKFIDPIIKPIIQHNSVSYIIETLERKGNINKDKLAEYLIPTNKMSELMKKGSVTIVDKIISIDQVRNPDIKPFKIIIADIMDEQELQQFQNQIPKYDQVLLIIHINEISFERYKEFLNNYQCEHLLAAYTKPSNFQLSHEILCNKLNQQYPNNFPQIIRQFIKIPDDLKQFLAHEDMMEYIVLPIKNQGYQMKQLVKQDLNVMQQIIQQNNQQQYANHQSRLIFLGTSSMKPGKYRNVSGILIQQENYNVILDCGEGTYKQIVDHQIDLQKPIIIWISHSHSDHHMGLFELLNNLRNQLIYLIVPAIMVPWITYYQEGTQEIFNIKLIFSQQFEQEDQISIEDLIKDSYHQQRIRYGPKLNEKQDYQFVQNLEDLRKNFKNQIIDIQTVQVDHCPQAYGIKFHFIDGTILTYSGDTRPCQAFQNLSKDSTLFIHEATFSNDLQENALNNKHSTIQEAIDVGRSANSETIILTHFSQRMAKGLEGIEEYMDQNIVFACDHLSANFNEFKNIGNMSIEISKSLGEN